VADDLRFTEPRYTVAEAARYVGMPPSTLASWAKGYTRHFANRPTVKQGPVITSLPSATGSGATIPFIGLVEATVVQAFRQTGLPLQRVRRALQVLADQGELEHALASKRLYSDGAQVLYDYASNSGDQMLRLLTVVDSGQRVFHEVISHYLRRISFDGTWASGLILPVSRCDRLPRTTKCPSKTSRRRSVQSSRRQPESLQPTFFLHRGLGEPAPSRGLGTVLATMDGPANSRRAMSPDRAPK